MTVEVPQVQFIAAGERLCVHTATSSVTSGRTLSRFTEVALCLMPSRYDPGRLSLNASGLTMGVQTDPGHDVSHTVPIYGEHTQPHAIASKIVTGLQKRLVFRRLKLHRL